MDVGTSRPEPPRVRPPRQRRTAEAWQRILDCGVAILEESGYDAFTIAAVCERADVPPPAIYARVDSKEDLFLAVYEHGIARVRAAESVLADDGWAGLSPAQVVERAVVAVLDQFRRHHAFLRAVVLLSSSHEEIRRRGAWYVHLLRDLFVARVAPVTTGATRERAARASTAFDAVFATAVFRTAYGEDFLRSPDWAGELVGMQQTFLLGSGPDAGQHRP